MVRDVCKTCPLKHSIFDGGCTTDCQKKKLELRHNLEIEVDIDEFSPGNEGLVGATADVSIDIPQEQEEDEKVINNEVQDDANDATPDAIDNAAQDDAKIAAQDGHDTN